MIRNRIAGANAEDERGQQQQQQRRRRRRPRRRRRSSGNATENSIARRDTLDGLLAFVRTYTKPTCEFLILTNIHSFQLKFNQALRARSQLNT